MQIIKEQYNIEGNPFITRFKTIDNFYIDDVNRYEY